jgi:hypothetical protein
MFYPEILAIFKIVWKNNVELGRPQMTIWRMRFACWVTKATDTQPECVILFSFPLEQWLREHTSLYITRTLPVWLLFIIR